MWRADLVRTRTGQLGAQLDFTPDSSSPTEELNGIPSGQLVLRRDWYATAGIPDAWFTPYRNGVVLSHRYTEDEPWVPIVAGPLVHFPSAGKDKISLDFQGIQSVLTRRYLTHEWRDYPSPDKWLSGGFYAEGSLGQIAWMALQETLIHKPSGGLPIVHGTPDEFITDDTRKGRGWKNWDVSNAGLWEHVLLGMSQEDGGPDLRFTPRWSDTTERDLVWAFEHGTHRQPRIAHPYTIRLDETAEISPVADLDVTRSGLVIAQRVYASGAGEGPGTVVRVSERIDYLTDEMPLLEAYVADTQRTTAAEVLALAAGSLHPSDLGAWEISCTVRTDRTRPLWQFRPGAPIEVTISDRSPALAAGTYRGYILSVSYHLDSDTVDLKIEEG